MRARHSGELEFYKFLSLQPYDCSCLCNQTDVSVFFLIALSDHLSANFIIFNEFLIAICQFSRIVPLFALCRGYYRGTEMEGTSDDSHSSKMWNPWVGLGHSPNFPHAG